MVRHQDMNPKENQGRWFKAHTVHVSTEIKRIGAGMLGEQGEKKKNEEKIEGAKNFFFFVCRKNKNKSNWPRLKQIDLGWKKLT